MKILLLLILLFIPEGVNAMSTKTMWSPTTGTFQYNPDSGLALPPGAQEVGVPSPTVPTPPSSSSSGGFTPPANIPMPSDILNNVGNSGGGFTPPPRQPTPSDILNGNAGSGGGGGVPSPPSGGGGGGLGAGMGPIQNGAPLPRTPQEEEILRKAAERERLEAQRQAKLNALRGTISGLKNNLQNDFSRSQQKIQDSRVLNNEQLKRNTNPFSGRTGYQMAQTQREYAQVDEANQRALMDRMAGLDAQLVNVDVQSQEAMERDLREQFERDRAYALQLEQAERQRQQDNFERMTADRNFRLQEGQLTGNYVNPEAQKTLSEILELKRLAEASSNPMQYKAQADKLRERLASMGVDPSAVGFDADYNTAVNNVLTRGIGTQTLASRNQNFNQNMAMREQDFKEKSYMQTFQENARQFDTETAIKQAYQDGQLSLDKARVALQAQQNAISAANMQNDNAIASRRIDLDERKFDFEKNQGPKQQALTSYTSSLNQRFLDRDNQVNDVEGLESAILALPVDNTTKAALYKYYGIPME